VSSCLFDYAIFDHNIFETCFIGSTQTGSARRNKKTDWDGFQKRVMEEAGWYEMKLSEQLQKQLTEAQIATNQIAAMNKALIKEKENLMGVVTDITNRATDINRAAQEMQQNLAQRPPEIDVEKRAQLLLRLDAARAAKEEKKRAEKEKEKQMLKNLAKARRVKARNRGN